MKFIPAILFCFFLPKLSPGWMLDFSKARQEANESNRFILLNFSGSDWCTPCIRMHKTIFQSNSFEAFAAKELVLVNADFPRLGKNQLSPAQRKQNEDLADKYNPGGKFPFTLLLNKEGKVMHAWEGCPDEQAEQFVAELNGIIYGAR